MERARLHRLLRLLLLSALGIGVLVFMAALDEVFGPLLFALLLAYILNPVVNAIQRARIPRAPAIGVLFLLIYSFFVGFILLTVPTFIRQVESLYFACRGDLADPVVGETGVAEEEIVTLEKPWRGRIRTYIDVNENGKFDPGYVREFGAWFQHLKKKLEEEQPGAMERVLDQVQERLVAIGPGVFDTAVTTLSDLVYSLLGFLTVFILIPIYLFYFLMGLSKIRERAYENLPGRYRERIIRILEEIDEAVSAFFRGRLIIMLIKGIVTSIGLVLLGVPFALVVGLITAVASLIPIAGFLMGMIPGVAIALLDSQSIAIGAYVVVLFVLIEVFENYFLTPWILKERVHLHPITLVVSVFVGGELFGFVGMLLAVPMTSVMKILWKEFLLPQVRVLAAEEP